MSSLEFVGITLLFFSSDTETKTMIPCLAGFLKTLLTNIPLPVSSSFFSRVTNIKPMSANITFSLSSFSSFLSPRSCYYSFPFPPLVWFSALSDTRNLPFGPLPLSWLQTSLGSFPKIRIDIYILNSIKRCFGIGHLGIRTAVQWFASVTTKQ